MRTILAHGPWYGEWHHLLPFVPLVFVLGFAWVRSQLVAVWHNRWAMVGLAAAFVAFGFLIDGHSEIGHHVGSIVGGLFAGRAVSL